MKAGVRAQVSPILLAAVLLTPVLFASGSALAAPVVALAAGDVLTLGGDGLGQLGNGPAGGGPAPGAVLAGASDVAAGREFTLALVGGAVYAWGDDSKGQVGDGGGFGPSSTVPTAVALPAAPAAVAVATGHYHGLAMMADGTVRAWGWNSRGQLGPAGGSTLRSASPVEVLFPGHRAVQVAGGRAHSVALLDDGSIWTWGDNGSGQLGQGVSDALRHPAPARVAVPGSPRVTSVAGGRDSTFAVDDTGRLWAWGNNQYGQLGTGSTAAESSPRLVTGVSGVSRVESGADHTVAVLTDGRVFTWGRNRFGQLGSALGTVRLSPAVVAGLPLVSDVFSGRDHVIALARNGEVWTWGRNDQGQLGRVATTGKSPTPTVVPALAGVRDAGAGQVHTVALR